MNQAKQTKDAIEILRVSKQKKKYLVEITPYGDFLDKEIFTENQIVESRIFKGQIFLISEWEEILKNKSANDLFDKILNYLSFGLRTKKEIKDYLYNHDASDEEINIVLQKLENLQFIDDHRYAKYYLNKVINNKKGPIYFKNELKNKGVDSVIIDLVVDDYDERVINDNINTIIKKELPNLKTYPVLKQKEKIYQKLLRLGYSNSSINYNLSKIEFVSDYLDRLKNEIEILHNKSVDETKIKQKLLLKGYNYQEINTLLKEIIKK